MKNIVIMTGPSGSGLSSAEFVYEELGYYVIKNPTANSINAVLDDLIFGENKFENFCLMVHPLYAEKIIKICRERNDANYRFIALMTSEEELSRRYSLSRHVHPRAIAYGLSTQEAIIADIEDTLGVSEDVDLFIDTSSLTVKQLRTKLYKFLENIEENKITNVTFMSFGMKNGIPQGLDTFLDVRNIPNPYWVDELKALTGEDQKVIDYMMSYPITGEILDSMVKYLTVQLEEVKKSGRGSYVVGIACSGGQHRSTFVANYLADYFSNDYRTQVIHKDSPALNK